MSALGTLIACHDCDLLHRRAPLPPRASARCVRCGSTLYRDLGNGIERALAMSVASIALLLVANFFPFISFEFGGLGDVNHVASGVLELDDQGYWPLAALVAFVIVVAPAVRLCLLVFVTAALHSGRRPPGLGRALKLAGRLREWAMLDVFLLGTLVAIIKLSDIGHVHLGTGIYAYGTLILTLSVANAAFDPHDAWELLENPA